MNDLLSRMLLRVTQASPVEPVLTSRYERAGTLESGETFEPVEGESETEIESRPMTRTLAEHEDAAVFAAPMRKMAWRRSVEAEQGHESSNDAELRGGGEQRKSLDAVLRKPETQRRAASAEAAKPAGTWPGRDERAPSVRDVRIERERTPRVPANPPLRALSPTRELPKEAAGPTDVHITIGHIEVRAATAPAKAPARKATPPSVSLQDYLSRRNGGAR